MCSLRVRWSRRFHEVAGPGADSCREVESFMPLLDRVGGLLLNAVAGWWWADPAAALAMAPIIAQEGRKALKGEPCPTCD